MTNLQMAEKPVAREDGALDIEECFLTIQGEGPFAGRVAVFVRTAGCNLQCPLCDTIYTSPLRRLVECGSLLAEVIHRANGVATLVVLTGGEPLRQRCGPFIRALIANGFEVQIETNGTLWDSSIHSTDNALTVVCSPKAGVNTLLMPRISALKYIVREGEVDIYDGLPICSLASTARPGRPWFGFDGEVYVQPCDEGDADRNKQNMIAAVASCMKFGYRLCVQTHKIAGVP